MTHDEILKQAMPKDEPSAEKMMRRLNDAYRVGTPLISDQRYDAILAGFATKFPNNAFFNQKEVEPEPELIEGKTVKLPERMLSTNKAYSVSEIEKWANGVIAVGKSLGIAEGDIFFRVTPKLDGYASYDEGVALLTRGDGRSGTDITRVLDRGMMVAGKKRGLGPGEIVVDKEFFEQELSKDYENPRNVIAGVIKEGELDKKITFAITVGAIYFQPFSELNGFLRDKAGLFCDIEKIWDWNEKDCAYSTDGLVIEAIDENIKKAMGCTNHHHKWQIAYKKNEEFHNIKVTGLVWQTSKNGRLTPVVQLEPTKISGVTVSKATGHHFGNIVDKGIWPGATVKVCRSGLVIPYIAEVVEEVNLDEKCYPSSCPSCGSATEIDGDNMLCVNTETCPAQIEGMIEFFFKTLGNCDGFGPKVIEQIRTMPELKSVNGIVDVYNLTDEQLMIKGFGEKTAFSLIDELLCSKRRPVEDWRFLAAFSIHNVGKGGCEKLLSHHRLKDVFDLEVGEIIQIDGFAFKTATSLVESLARIKPQFDALMKMGFNLLQTTLLSDRIVDSQVRGYTVVFTGSMQQGKRDDMEKQAKLLGAKVGSSVSAKTDYLVIGQNVGAAKTQAAEKHGVTVLTEVDYLKMIAS